MLDHSKSMTITHYNKIACSNFIHLFYYLVTRQLVSSFSSFLFSERKSRKGTLQRPFDFASLPLSSCPSWSAKWKGKEWCVGSYRHTFKSLRAWFSFQLFWRSNCFLSTYTSWHHHHLTSVSRDDTDHSGWNHGRSHTTKLLYIEQHSLSASCHCPGLWLKMAGLDGERENHLQFLKENEKDWPVRKYNNYTTMTENDSFLLSVYSSYPTWIASET